MRHQLQRREEEERWRAEKEEAERKSAEEMEKTATIMTKMEKSHEDLMEQVKTMQA